MSLKRPFDDSTPPRARPLPPPQKRYRLQSSDSFSSSPSTATSSSSLATPGGPFSTPYTPPSDSPTNPFGRIRKLALNGSEPLALPRATSFSKHLPLRFQLIRIGGGADAIGEGTYRIVQVPLNYTFRHLHKLLFFLFDDSSSTHSELRPDLQLETGGHLFEVQDSIRMYPTKNPNALSRVGQIRSGHTWAKLSSVRDPFRKRKIRDEDAVEDEGGEGEEDWIWEAEEDFTVGHVWPEGGDLKRGCVYHHTPTTQIHITINTTRIPGRKGVGNKPFVFGAFGSGWAPLGERRLLGLGLRGLGIRGIGVDEEGGEERIESGRWNGHEAFEKFLRRDKKRENLRAQDHRSPSSSPSPSPSSSSNPIIPHPPTHPHPHPTQTPLPQTKLHRLRVQYASRRLERLTKKGLGELGEEVGFEEEVDGDELGEEGEVC
ncbi:hypothetical protein PILCRDRAFT_816778 [Piloderma croceum F 1598]|uniref:Uncharacterized protein n=1 Tax=Piloderma croceum (strain F 1598) TaxID=765440 RepID=A0A0C3BGZ4_PILCF|nr:hypothetical protein PILCRDRAFT_816778 [Piloderma croceum F 1598]